MSLKKQLTHSNLKLKVGNEQLYFDVDELMSNIEIPGEKDGTPTVEINLPKFEFFKLMLDTACGIVEDVDENLGVVCPLDFCFGLHSSTASLVSKNSPKKKGLLGSCNVQVTWNSPSPF